MKNIGKRLYAVRVKIGENQSTFAARFGVDQATYCRWENEDRHPSKATVVLMQRILAELNAQINGKSIEAGS
jgi:transcriptional regulator with XRE-family HTH domain